MSTAKAVVVTGSGNHEEEDQKSACRMVQHFKNKFNCVSGDLNEHVHENFQNYEILWNDYKLSFNQP